MAARTNPGGGRKSDKLMRDALMIALHREIAPSSDRKYLTEIAQKAVEMAAGGNERMIQFVAERIDGKAVQPIGGDEDSPPILQRIERVIVRAANPNT